MNHQKPLPLEGSDVLFASVAPFKRLSGEACL